MAERYLYIEGYGNFPITEHEAERLEAGKSITINIFKTDTTMGAELKDLYTGMNPAIDPKKLDEQMNKVIGHESKYNYPRSVHHQGETITDPHWTKPTLDERLTVNADHEPKYNYPRIEDQQEWAKEYAKRRYGSEEAHTEFYRKRLTVNTDYDPVSRPAHYTEGREHEPKDVIRDWGLNFNLGSAVKYLSRSGRKDAAITDLEKAKTFIQFEIEALAEEGEEEE